METATEVPTVSRTSTIDRSTTPLTEFGAVGVLIAVWMTDVRPVLDMKTVHHADSSKWL